MSWIAARAPSQNLAFNPNGLDAGRFDAQVPRHAMPQGTLLLDIVMPDHLNQPLDYIDYEKWNGYRRSLSLLLDPKRKLWLAVEQGGELQIASLSLASFPAGAPIRIQYAWDTTTQIGHLSAHNIATGDIKLQQFTQTAALALDDLARIFFCRDGRILTQQISTMCIADHVEKIGYSSGLGSNAYVMTERGPVPIGDIKQGDLVVTGEGELNRVQATVHSYMPAFGHIRPVELRRPFMNLAHTLAVSSDTCVILEGSDAEYYFGCHSVSVSTRHIIPFLPLPYANQTPMVALHQIVLQDWAPFHASGGLFMPLRATHDTSDHTLHARTRLASTSPQQLECETNPAVDRTSTLSAPPRNLFAHEATVLLSERYL